MKTSKYKDICPSVYFREAEFQKVGCSSRQMSLDLLTMLDQFREIYGQPVTISSAYRSVEHEKSKGRPGTSSHCKGLAVDIYCIGDQTRFDMLNAALFAGFRRIGVGATFLHLDIDPDKTQDCIWTY